MIDMIRRILAGILHSKTGVYPDHVHMTKDGILYTSPDELLRSDTVKKQIRKMDALGLKKNGRTPGDRTVE
jgi:hypothetical protein